MNEAQVQSAFLAAPPLIDQTILDLTIKHPSFLRDIPEVAEWPLGNGSLMTQLILRGQMPQIERGFNQWKKQLNNTGCTPCDGPDCAYNWSTFGGLGIEQKVIELMERDFQTEAFCIKNIQTTAHFEEIFGQFVKNLYAQTDFFKTQNISFNFLTSIAKKYVVDSGGPKPNKENPYVYRTVGTTDLAALNMELLERFYEWMVKLPDAIPYDVVDGAPIFSLLASRQLLARLYRDDPNLRQDVRFSGLANDMLMKYNFMSTIRGMFIAAPILYPRRFIVVAGELVEVLPFVNNIPVEVGSYTGLNPAYEDATTHEEVIIHGKFPFKIYTMPTAESLGANTSFGPEPRYFDYWKWINPETNTDPFRRVGYFASHATVGLAAQHSEAVFAIVVARPSVLLTAQWNPIPVCPPVQPDCDNEVPATGCPCPLILSVVANPTVPGNFFLTLSVAVDAEVDDDIQFGIDTGGYVTGTVVTISADGKAVEVTFDGGETIDLCNRFTTVFCDDTLGCSASVLSYEPNCTDATRLNLVLSNNIKAEVGETVTVFFGDGTSDTSVTVVSFDMTTNTWVFDLGATAFCDQVGGVVSVCVPTATDATCPACGNEPTFAACET